MDVTDVTDATAREASGAAEVAAVAEEAYVWGPHQPRIGETLARRQQGQDPRTIHIAWRAKHRLHQRWAHPHDERREPAGVIAIACARELAAFCWEAATLD
jgi:hypothetical protein